MPTVPDVSDIHISKGEDPHGKYHLDLYVHLNSLITDKSYSFEVTIKPINSSNDPIGLGGEERFHSIRQANTTTTEGYIYNRLKSNRLSLEGVTLETFKEKYNISVYYFPDENVRTLLPVPADRTHFGTDFMVAEYGIYEFHRFFVDATYNNFNSHKCQNYNQLPADCLIDNPYYHEGVSYQFRLNTQLVTTPFMQMEPATAFLAFTELHQFSIEGQKFSAKSIFEYAGQGLRFAYKKENLSSNWHDKKGRMWALNRIAFFAIYPEDVDDYLTNNNFQQKFNENFIGVNEFRRGSGGKTAFYYSLGNPPENEGWNHGKLVFYVPCKKLIDSDIIFGS